MVPPAVARLSRAWFPSGGIAVSGVEDAHSKLIRAGLLRQSNAGMFHMLPLGRRVQDKIEALVAGHMEDLLGKSLTRYT
jgi:prolyl-tRNA synthetase